MEYIINIKWSNYSRRMHETDEGKFSHTLVYFYPEESTLEYRGDSKAPRHSINAASTRINQMHIEVSSVFEVMSRHVYHKGNDTRKT